MGTHGGGIVYVEHADGDFLLVASFDGETLVKVDVETGAQSEVSMAVAFEADGLMMFLMGAWLSCRAALSTCYSLSRRRGRAHRCSTPWTWGCPPTSRQQLPHWLTLICLCS